jgi:hypothetical protein
VLQNTPNADHKDGDFIVVAFPAEYHSSGIMTFVVDQNDVAHEKDLGDQSAAQAKNVVTSNPEAGWKKVE